MALWTDGKRYLWTGRSGLQYRKAIQCSRTREEAERLITGFFGDSGAKQSTGERQGMLVFTRGHLWMSRLSWILPCSEKWPRQDIVVEFGQNSVEVSYNVRMGCCMVFKPNALVNEAAELECLLRGSK